MYKLIILAMAILALGLTACGKSYHAQANTALDAAGSAYTQAYKLIQQLDAAGKIPAEAKPEIQARMSDAQTALDVADNALIAYTDALQATGDATGATAVRVALEAAYAPMSAAIGLLKPYMPAQEYQATLIIIDAAFANALKIIAALEE